MFIVFFTINNVDSNQNLKGLNLDESLLTSVPYRVKIQKIFNKLDKPWVIYMYRLLISVDTSKSLFLQNECKLK